jgi:hypothetical protein
MTMGVCFSELIDLLVAILAVLYYWDPCRLHITWNNIFPLLQLRLLSLSTVIVTTLDQIFNASH